jgi:formylglycine-generating enzyme required for sulfatase activity
MKKWIIFFSFLLSSIVFSNNLLLENISLVNQSTGSHTFVKFDISWDNSWRGGTDNGSNWDAAWVFVKYKVSGGDWQHATLNSSGHTIPTGSTIETSSDGKGIFIYRNADGTGTNNWDGTELRWDYITDGVADDADVTVKVFGIEMVYIPQGSFYVGDGTSTNITAQLEAGTSGSPFQITGEGSLTLGGGGAGSIGNNNKTGQFLFPSGDDFDDAASQTLPAAFPKGYDSFYIMKYEISQQQYADFLNCLTRTQQNTRTFVNISGTSVDPLNTYVMVGTGTKYRNSIRCSTTLPATGPITVFIDKNGDATTGDGAHIAANFLNWEDSKAYADWAGIRPMTELEFEKACRGPNSAVVNEYAWGSTNIKGAPAYSLTNNAAANEAVTLISEGNACYTSSRDAGDDGPFRCGIFADGSGTRLRSGSTYYGVMEMSGNLAEQVVPVSTSGTRAFDGAHGNGSLDATGNANVTNWPTHKGFRGNGFSDPATNLRVSERQYSYIEFNTRVNTHGFRAVRTAP